MRIALISYEYPPETGFGGIGTYTHYHARALSRLGHEVHVFAGTQVPERRTYRDGNVIVTRSRKVGLVERLLPKLDLRGLHWFKNRLQNAANSFGALRQELRHGDFDVVEMPECGGEGALINHCLDLPTVVRLHSPAELIMGSYPSKLGDRVLTGMVERLGMSGARALSACSHWLAREVRERGVVDRPITVIPNGIDLSVFDQDEGIDIHERFGVPRDGLKVFFANRLEHRKGIHVVRDLLVPVLERHPQVTFVLAGADPDDLVVRELRPMLAERGLEGRLVHLGRIPLREVRACLKQCEIFLLPSIWENAPYSLLEAMSAGKAIVASDCGGVPEMMRHEIDGILARTGDAAAFARAIDRLQSAGLRSRLGQSARARVEARFTDDLVARRSLEFYHGALGAPLVGPAVKLVRPGVELGPANWFQAWWMRGVDSGEHPLVGADFGKLGLDELAFVHAVSARAYSANHLRVEAEVVSYLDQLAGLHRQRAIGAQGGAKESLVTGELGLPAISHPIFGDDTAGEALLDELWRLGAEDLVADWLVRETAATEIADLAIRRMALRRLAIEAFRRRPDEHTARVLHRIYRTVGSSAHVVQQDRDFIASHPKGSEFAAVIADLGLHAPLRRPAVFAPDRRRRKASPVAAEVTVLIPSYRHEAFIGKAIESVLAQTHERVRVLVVDDCSPDGTAAAARAIDDPRVEVRSNDANLGLGGSILAALPTVKTPYVALLNSDDVFHPQRLERCLVALETDPNAALAATRIAIMDEKERRLLPENSCVLDLGAAAHGWVRWYDRVTAPLTDEDWISLPALLRHNHLATSSNVVCRTDFLREQAAAIAPLKYCLDWSLFLHACVAGSLRFVPEALVGYRLHGSNTVWFDDGSRPGYLHEVNAVVADAMRCLVARRRTEGASAEAIAEEVAGLLQSSVSAHGETDGMALFLANLTAELHGTPATFRSPELVRLAELALASRKPAPDTESLRRARLDRHAIEALVRRTRELEPRVGRLSQELTDARGDRADAEAFRQRIDAELAVVASTRAEVESATAEVAAITEQAAALQQSLADTRKQLAGTTEKLTATETQLAAERQELAELLQESQAIVRRLESDLGDTTERLGGLLAEHTATERELQSVGDDLEANRALLRESTQEVERLEGELAAARIEHQRASDRASRNRIEHRRDLARFEQGLEFRIGRLTRKLHLLGLLKTFLRWGTRVRIGAARFVGGMQRRRPGRKPARVVFACDGAFPSSDSGRIATELLAVAGAGFDARVLCWAAGSPHWLGSALHSALEHRVVLSHDAALMARDRRFFQRRHPAAVAAIDAFPAQASALAPVFTFARSAQSLAAGYLHATGLGPAALAVWGASRLLGVQFGLRLETGDLALLEQPGWRAVASAANALLVDGDSLADRVRSVLGAATPSVLIVPLLVPGLRLTGDDRGAGPFVCIGPFAEERGLLLLADAAKSALDRGMDLRFEILGVELDSVPSQTAVDWFRERLAKLGILDRFDFRSHCDPVQVAASLARAMAVVELRTGAAPDVPGPSLGIVAAMAAGRPVIAFDGALEGAVQDGVEGRLVASGDAIALGSALVELAGDSDLRAKMGKEGRRTYDRRFTPGVARAEFCARIRALLNARMP